jgi:hypothetical protein
VNITTNPRQDESRDAMLAELTRAFEEVTRASPSPAGPNEEIFAREDDTSRPSERRMPPATRGRFSLARALPLWSLIGLLAVVGIGLIALTWRSPDGRAVKLTSAASVDAARTDTGLQPPTFQAEITRQHAGATAAPSSPELTQWVQTMARELADLKQGIEQLKTSQADLARDNAELAGQLKETQDQMARREAELAGALNAAQEMARENLNTAEQLKASQEQIAGIAEQLKARQEQMDRLAASKQLQHPPKSASPPSSPPNVTPTPKSSPKPPSLQGGPLPKNSTPSQSRQP